MAKSEDFGRRNGWVTRPRGGEVVEVPATDHLAGDPTDGQVSSTAQDKSGNPTAGAAIGRARFFRLSWVQQKSAAAYPAYNFNYLGSYCTG